MSNSSGFFHVSIGHLFFLTIFFITDEPERKRARIEEDQDVTELDLPEEPLVSGKIHVHYVGEDELVFDVSYESGSMGKTAVVELSQFFKNRLSNEFVKDKCKNAPAQ